MNWLSIILDILKIILPALIVAFAVIYTIRSFLARDEKVRLIESKINAAKDVTLTRLQAYERMTLLLERMHPASVINRVWQSNMSAKELQYAFTITLQAEYDHNVAQQIYISSEAWELIAEAKEELTKLANMIGNSLPQDATAAQFSKIYLDTIANSGHPLPTETALNFLKQEFTQVL
jgi:hypothetical protein